MNKVIPATLAILLLIGGLVAQNLIGKSLPCDKVVMTVMGSSMWPTFNSNQSYELCVRKQAVHKGDVVLVELNDQTLIKRIIAEPNDNVSCLDSVLTINRVPQKDLRGRYRRCKVGWTRELNAPLKEHYLLGSDNEDSLEDLPYTSRPIPQKLILGSVIKYEPL